MTIDALHAPDPTVVVSDVSKWFGQKVAVSEVSCSFGPGITGLLGPNGAGKTTLLRVMTGLLRPSDGRVRVLGLDPIRRPAVYRRMALVPEDEAVWGQLSARRFVEVSARLARVDDPVGAAASALDIVELDDEAHRPLHTFSKGMRQRTKVAAALVNEPEILFLDEPLNGTDPVQRSRLIGLFRRLAAAGRTVIVSSHVLAEVERMASRVIAMVDGRIAAAGDVTSIRAAMSDQPRLIRIDTDRARRLGAALLEEDFVGGVSVEDGVLHVRASDPEALGAALPALSRRLEARLTRVEPEDESLESVFRYLVRGRR